MKIKSVKLVCFSPTGTTRTVLESIARGIGVDDVGHVDMTLLQGAGQAVPPFSDELVLIGAPVYGGRLPKDAIERFRKMKASGTPAVLIVLYGNREFEDALLELKNLAVELGFVPVAGGAFIGEHSFATTDFPIATGRPDSADVQIAVDFGAKIREKVAALPSAADADLEVPGRFPYESPGARPLEAAPETVEETCTLCGTCAEVCPTGAISVGDRVETVTGLCIRCCACVKSCPTGARVMTNSVLKEITAWLNENCSARKEPQLFGVDV